MKNTNISIAFLVTILIGLASCQKKYMVSIPFSDLFKELKESPQVFSGEAGQSWTIVGKKGTRINFNPRSFRNNNGDIISSGVIDISLIETPKLGDMMKNAVTTKVWGAPSMLRTSGSIKLEVTQNGQPITVGDGYGIDFLQDSARTLSMSIFSGVEEGVPVIGIQRQSQQSSAFINSDGFITWGEGSSNTQAGTRVDTASLLNYYMFNNVTSFDWINSDVFYSDPRPKTNIEINLLGKEVGNYGATVYVIYPEINSLMTLYQTDLNDLNRLSFGNFPSAPVGIKARFVALAKVDGEYYFAKSNTNTVANNHSQSMQLEKKPIADIKIEMSKF